MLSSKPKHSLARVRAQILHILYEFGREDHQFRLRFNGQYLKDSLTLEDYDIMDNAVLKMVPMSKDSDVSVIAGCSPQAMLQCCPPIQIVD